VSAAGAAGIGRGMRRRPAALAATIACVVAITAAAAAPAATTRACGSVRDPYPGTRYAVVTDKETTATAVLISTLRPARNQGSVGGYRAILQDQLFGAMFSARLEELMAHPVEAPIATNR